MHFFQRLAAASLLLLATACDAPKAPDMSSDGKIVQDPNAPLGQLPDTVTPEHYRIDLTIRPDQPRYSGIVEIDLDLKVPQKTVYLHGHNLNVEGVTARLNGRSPVKATYAQVHESGVAQLSFDQELPKGKVTVRLPFSAEFETAPDALTSMTENGEKYAWTQFEAISARRAFPSFDEPRFKTPFDITITARAADTVVSNTLPIKEEEAAGGLRKTVFATTQPLPTYLVAIVVGPYDVTPGPTVPAWKQRTAAIPLRGITVSGKGDRVRYALEQTPMLLRYLEDYFATPYPYPKLDLITPPNFTAGGMENAGAITYTERGILLDETASVQQKRYFTLLHAHELAHQWFGDFVTPKWWNDIWLNESFATWMGNKSSASVWPQGEFDRETLRDALDVMDQDSLSTARAIRQPIESNDDIANAFDGLTYDKGGAILEMFESYLGPDAFREGLRTHMRRFAHGSADVRDFMNSLAQGSGKPEVVPAFESFLNQPGLPLIRVQSTCRERDLEVSISQSAFGTQNVSDKRLWSVPVCMRNLSKSAPPSCTILTTRATTMALKNQCGAVLFPNANGAGYYRFAQTRSEWQALGALTAKMTPTEQMAMLHSLRSAFRSGDTDGRNYLATLQAIGKSGTWDTIESVTAFLMDIRGNMLTKADVRTFEQRIRAWATPLMASVGLEPRRHEPPSAALTRAALAELMTKAARDPAILSALASKGAVKFRQVLQSQPDAALAPELVPASLWAAVFTGGAPMARECMSAIKASSEAEFRLAAIKALTAARDPKAIAEIEEFVASGALTVRETRNYLREVFDDAERRGEAWAWLRKDFKRLSDRVPKDGRARFVGLAAKLCTDSARAEIEWFFKPMIGEIVGAPRVFANTLETVDRCVSWRKARGLELAAALREP
ncbi:MAG: M1 family metallopeptidase [Alphaproteobacteria bacterium]|nr:M1 family metallopeptidase [Alphaproteobacteria bacterium]